MDINIQDTHTHLVLGRLTDEGIIIDHPDGDVMIRVVKSNGRNHRISIVAPKQVGIVRDELNQNHPLRSR